MESVDEREIWEFYYNAMEYLDAGDDKKSENLLKKAININKDFVAAYLGMVSVYRSRADRGKMDYYTLLAFEKTKKKFPKWPKEMSWRILENRQYFRSICGRAILYHENKEKKEAADWLKRSGEDNEQQKLMFTDLAGKISQEIQKQNPSFWWESLWTSKRRK